MSFLDRLAHAANAFVRNERELERPPMDYGPSYFSRPDRRRAALATDRSIVSSIYTRIGIDVTTVDMRHVVLDQNGRFLKLKESSGLNNCLSLEANIDQAARHFMLDAVLTLFDKGVVALVPIDTSVDTTDTGAYDIHTMRVGEITGWYPKHIRVDLYNEKTAQHEELVLLKRTVAIVQNPLYNVMNEPNSTLQRLIRKLALIDSVDEQTSSGKLDIIIQLPYTVKTQTKRDQAETRRTELERQMKDSKYGIGYIDGTERITQLNRPAENNMLRQVEYLTNMLYSQLGITEAVFDGTAGETEMLNYHNRTIEPILTAFQQAMERSFLTKTARTQRQAIRFYRDPFKLVSMEKIAEIADKFTRNEIVSSNEMRGAIGMAPSTDPKADELRNSNMPQPKDEDSESEQPTEERSLQNGRGS